MRRVGLFVMTNLAVLVVFGFVMNLAEPWLRAQGIDVNQAGMLLFALIFGMGGALLQGVLNTFVLLLSRVLGQVIDRAVFRSERGYGPGYFLVVIVLQIVLGVLASMITMAFSRWREFRADDGGARLAGRQNMIAALRRLGQVHGKAQLPESVEAFGIRGRVGQGFKRLFMSHPPLEERIRALSEGGR